MTSKRIPWVLLLRSWGFPKVPRLESLNSTTRSGPGSSGLLAKSASRMGSCLGSCPF
jgi:hypothetical protein